MTPEVKKIGNKLFDKVELASHKIELADMVTFQKAVEGAETSLDLVSPAFQKAKDGLLVYKLKAQEAMRAYDNVMTQYAELTKAAKQLGLELPPQAKSGFERAKAQLGIQKQRFNSVDKALASL